MTREVARILAESLIPLYNKEVITVLTGLVKTVSQERNNNTIRFPVPYDTNSGAVQIENSALVPDKTQRAIIYFEGSDTSITDFDKRKSQASSALKLVCWYNSLMFNQPENISLHEVLIGNVLKYIAEARPEPDSVIKTFGIDVTRVYDSNPALFSKYSYREERGQYLQTPYFSFAIDITVEYQLNHGCDYELIPIDADHCC